MKKIDSSSILILIMIGVIEKAVLWPQLLFFLASAMPKAGRSLQQ